MHTILQVKGLVKDFLKNWRVKPGGKQILRAKGARRGSGPRCAWNDIRRGLRGFVRTCTGRVGRWDSGRAQPPPWRASPTKAKAREQDGAQPFKAQGKHCLYKGESKKSGAGRSMLRHYKGEGKNKERRGTMAGAARDEWASGGGIVRGGGGRGGGCCGAGRRVLRGGCRG